MFTTATPRHLLPTLLAAAALSLAAPGVAHAAAPTPAPGAPRAAHGPGPQLPTTVRPAGRRDVAAPPVTSP